MYHVGVFIIYIYICLFFFQGFAAHPVLPQFINMKRYVLRLCWSFVQNTSVLSVKSHMRLVSSRWDACVLQKPHVFACKVSVDVGSWPPGLINLMLDLAIKNQGFCSARASRRRETSPMSTLYNKTQMFWTTSCLKTRPIRLCGIHDIGQLYTEDQNCSGWLKL